MTELFFFFTRGGCVSCLRACLDAMLLLQSYQYPNLSEGADRVGGQLHGDKECPFSGVTKTDRVWRKVPESDARSVDSTPCAARLPGQGACWCTPASSTPKRRAASPRGDCVGANCLRLIMLSCTPGLVTFTSLGRDGGGMGVGLSLIHI